MIAASRDGGVWTALLSLDFGTQWLQTRGGPKGAHPEQQELMAFRRRVFNSSFSYDDDNNATIMLGSHLTKLAPLMPALSTWESPVYLPDTLPTVLKHFGSVRTVMANKTLMNNINEGSLAAMTVAHRTLLSRVERLSLNG